MSYLDRTYTYLSPGLLRRLSYSEYIRRRNNRYRTYMDRIYEVDSINSLDYEIINNNRSEERIVTQLSLRTLKNKTKVKINTQKNIDCAICQEEINHDNTQIVRILECKHIYHMDCIDNWLIIKRECPMCKLII